MFDIINKIYTERNSRWIGELDISISPFMINKFLSMNSKIAVHCSYLNGFVFNLKPSHWLLLAWKTIPKYHKAPFCQYIKKKSDEDIYEPIWLKVKKVLNSSENDMIYIKKYLMPIIEKDKETWFKAMGIDKKVWAKHNINYEKIKGSEGATSGKGGLELFGL